jgi:hypothetical protein
MFLQKNKKITFTYVGNEHPTFPPSPALNNLPEWYKNQKSYIEDNKKVNFDGANITIKKCIPVFDAITMGYIIFTQKDIWIDQTKLGPVYRWRGPENAVEFHSFLQADQHPLGHENYAYPKMMNPFSIKTPTGYSTYFKNISNYHNRFFEIVEGVVDTDQYSSPVNFPFIMKDKTWEGLIPAGTPVVQVIPFKREKWKMNSGGEKENKEQKAHNMILMSKFFNSYKTLFWNRKEFK